MDEVVNWIALGLLTGVLAVAAVTDIKTDKVYNWLTLPAIVVGLTLATLFGAPFDQAEAPGLLLGDGASWAGFQASLAATMLGLIGFGVLVVAGGLGFGDVKLMGAYGALTASWQCLVSAAIYAFIVGMVLALVVMWRSGLAKRTMHRLWNLVLSKAARASAEIPDDSPRVPFAVAIGVGGLLAAAEVLLGLNTPWAADW